MLLLAAACHHARPKLSVPAFSPWTGTPEALGEGELALTLACADSMGFDVSNTDSKFRGGRCEPCIPRGMQKDGRGAIDHARKLWALSGRAPHDTISVFLVPGCASLAFQLAKWANPGDTDIDVEFALFRTASSNDSIRALALRRMDTLVDSMVKAGNRSAAEHVLGRFALGMWERSERMLERPVAGARARPRDIVNTPGLSRVERDVHRLTEGAPALVALPAIPRTSDRYGVSEAEWAARLFDRSASLSDAAANRSAWHRLALAPWVVLQRWRSLDSAAAAMLVRAPNDSALLPARALAAYKQIVRPVFDAPAVMAMFDSAVVHMPRADSLRYDVFDDMLAASDDEWRYGFLPSDRERLDRRGWRVLDPLWSTPVNELRLARRARVAEADYRYADIATHGQSGSETVAGEMLLRRGPVDDAWTVVTLSGDRYRLRRGWRNFTATAVIDSAPDLWRAFYSGRLAPSVFAKWPVIEATTGCRTDGLEMRTIFSCTKARRADWTDVPFWGVTDTIDVSAARFRAPGDSVDIYLGARLPLRQFSHRDTPIPDLKERITLSAWLATPLGEPIFHADEPRPLPKRSEVAWTSQWTARVSHGDVMHRVEALEPGKAIGARGAVVHTNNAQVSIALRGPGMSDVLIAANARPHRAGTLRWSDYEIQPNGAVVAPREMFSMLWETYGLMPAPDGHVRWRVSLHRETGVRKRDTDVRGMLQGVKTAGERVVASEPEVPAMMYTRDEPAADAIAETMRFGLGDVPPGLHVVEVRIEDLVAKRTMSRSVSIRVLDPRAQQREATGGRAPGGAGGR